MTKPNLPAASPVPHRIEVDAVQVAAPILLIADGMLPEPPLPHRPFTAKIGARIDDTRCGLFDLSPAAGKIAVAVGQAPERMEMLRQNHRGIDLERSLRFHVPERLAQCLHVLGFSEQRTPLVRRR